MVRKFNASDDSKVLTRLENVQSNWCVYSAPLWSAKHKFNRTLADAPEHIQLLRISERDGCTEEIARNIINNQISRQEKLFCIRPYYE